MFSGPVTDVSSTRIFARVDGERQFLVYSMAYAADSEIAMVLPLPVQSGRGEDAVAFINLEGYRRFFGDLADAFELPTLSSPAYGYQSRLAVHQVGAFEASYIPTIADFDRLDSRFRLPDHLWGHLSRYRDWGFAVFQLRATTGDAHLTEWEEYGLEPDPRRDRDGLDAREVHPMALSFPTRRTDALYFPTVHVHDSTWRDEADFHHTLYCQFPARPAGWYPSFGPLGEYLRKDDDAGLIAREQIGYERALDGILPNEDTWVTHDALWAPTDNDPPRESHRERWERREEEKRRMQESPQERQQKHEEEQLRLQWEKERPMRQERARKKQSAHERAMLERYGQSEQPCKMKCGRLALKGKPWCETHTPIDTDIRLGSSASSVTTDGGSAREPARARRQQGEERLRLAQEAEERAMREKRELVQRKQSANERAMIERYGLSEQPCKMKCGRQALQDKPSCVAHTPVDTDIRLANM